MFRRMIRYLAIAAAVVATGFGLWFANAFLGNPLSAILARNAVDRYVDEVYSHLDLQRSRFGYDFKTGGYFAYLTSETSPDTAFYIRTDMLGNIRQDSYDTWVAHKYNTELRIREEYRVLTDTVFQSVDFPYELDIDYGDISFAGDAQWGEAEYDFALSRDILELDKTYDVKELGRVAGVLTVYTMDDEVTVERAAEIMLHIREIFDDAGVPFRMLDFVLRTPKPEDGAPWPDTAVYARLSYENLQPKGMEERIRESHQSILAEYARMNQEKLAEETSED